MGMNPLGRDEYALEDDYCTLTVTGYQSSPIRLMG